MEFMSSSLKLHNRYYHTQHLIARFHRYFGVEEKEKKTFDLFFRKKVKVLRRDLDRSSQPCLVNDDSTVQSAAVQQMRYTYYVGTKVLSCALSWIMSAQNWFKVCMLVRQLARQISAEQSTFKSVHKFHGKSKSWNSLELFL